VHGVEHFTMEELTDTDLKFAVLHVFHSVELYLKARLTKAHPLLIFVKPGGRVDDDSQTVGFDELMYRLRNAGVSISSEEMESLKALKIIRNRIEHFQIRTTKEEVSDYLGRAGRFLNRFLKDELDLVLGNFLDEHTYDALSAAIHTYEERLSRAKGRLFDALGDGGIKDQLDERVDFCPECGEETLSPDLADDNSLVSCFFCRESFYTSDCPRCGESIYFNEEPTQENDEGVCQGCWGWAMTHSG
jgi:predicted RNA-binding Zn-ribbon protein involved in translation (DUF1610 family)